MFAIAGGILIAIFILCFLEDIIGLLFGLVVIAFWVVVIGLVIAFVMSLGAT